MSDSIIRVRGLCKRFGDFAAVDGIDIDVRRGSIFAFLGANGSGKSTTIRMLIGLLAPTQGSIEVDGVDVVRQPRKVREHIGYMGQKVSLYQGLTLRENMEFYAGLYGIAPRDREQRWGRLRERFALGPVEDETTDDLPAGVRQRAGLALSTLHQPPVLFLDEPTAGVDTDNRALFWELIQDEAQRGTTIFVTTHFLEEVEYCDWVSFIDSGRLIANAAPEELRARTSFGYRADIATPATQRDAVAAFLHTAGYFAESVAGGLTLTTTDLDAELLRVLDELGGRFAGVSVQIEQAPMTTVFRAALGQREAA